MIIEMLQYHLKPRRIGLVEQLFSGSITERAKISPLGGCWRVDVGTLNQMIQVWPYEDMAARDSANAAAASLANWPPDIGKHLVDCESKILAPAPFSPPMEARNLGSVYEMRVYTYTEAAIPIVIERWQEKLEKRLKLSPLVGAWYSASGQERDWIHVWAYRDALERERIRKQALADRIWPPETHDENMMIRQHSMLLTAATFSPLQ